MSENTDQVQQFEAAMNDLEALVNKMESGAMSLEESLQAYERGIALFRQCQGLLETAQQRVKILSDAGDASSGVAFEGAER